jgi:flagellar biosynthesis protein FliQ
MSQELVLKLAKDTMQIALMVSGPMLIVSLVVGVVISIAQVVTSIQDMTISYVPRIIAVFVAFLFTFPWVMGKMLAFTAQIFGHLDKFAH